MWGGPAVTLVLAALHEAPTLLLLAATFGLLLVLLMALFYALEHVYQRLSGGHALLLPIFKQEALTLDSLADEIDQLKRQRDEEAEWLEAGAGEEDARLFEERLRRETEYENEIAYVNQSHSIFAFPFPSPLLASVHPRPSVHCSDATHSTGARGTSICRPSSKACAGLSAPS